MIYAYLRVSTDLQDVRAQQESIIDFCKRKDLKIDKYIKDEGVSGTVDYEERNLGKLLSRCQKGDTLIAPEMSRLGRNLMMVMRFLETCMKKELKVYTVKDGYELIDNIQSKVLAFAFGLAAEIERDMIVKRMKEGVNVFLNRGGVLGGVTHSNRRMKLSKFDAEVRKLCAEGKSLAYIGRCFGVTTECVSRYIEYNQIEYERKDVCRNKSNHSATLQKIEICRGAIEYGIMQGWKFQLIYKHVKKCHNIAIAEKTVRNYIRGDKYLNELWVDVRNKKRCEANVKATLKPLQRAKYRKELEYLNDKLSKNEIYMQHLNSQQNET